MPGNVGYCFNRNGTRYEKEISNWLDSIIKEEHVPESIIVLNIGIYEAEEGYCLYLTGHEEYDEDNDSWAEDVAYESPRYCHVHIDIDWNDFIYYKKDTSGSGDENNNSNNESNGSNAQQDGVNYFLDSDTVNQNTIDGIEFRGVVTTTNGTIIDYTDTRDCPFPGFRCLSTNDVFAQCKGFDIENISKDIDVNVGGKVFIYNSLTAYAVGDILKIDDKEIKKGINNFKLSPNRLEKKISKKGTTIIDDTYNANFDSMKSSLELLGKVKGFLSDLRQLS